MSRRHPATQLIREWQWQVENLRHLEEFFAGTNREAEVYARAARYVLERCISDLVKVRYSLEDVAPDPPLSPPEATPND
jgi:hypothetical protein